MHGCYATAPMQPPIPFANRSPCHRRPDPGPAAARRTTVLDRAGNQSRPSNTNLWDSHKKRAALGSLRPGERESHPGFLKAIREFVLSRPTSPKSRSPRPGPPRPGTSPPPTPSPPHQPQRYFNPRNPAMLTDSCRNLVDLAIFRQAFIEKYLTCSRPMQAFWLG